MSSVNVRATLYALLVHVVLLGLLMVNMEWKTKPQPIAQVVHAQLVSSPRLKTERPPVSKPTPAKPKAVKQEALPKPEKIKPEPKPEPKPKPKPEKKTETVKPEVPLKPEKNKPTEPLKAKEEPKAKTLQDEKRKRLAAQAAEEAKEMREQLLKEELAREQAQEQAEEQQLLRVSQQRQLNLLSQQYKTLIQQQVERNWRSPAGLQGQALSCTVLVKQLPSGEVIDVSVSECQGGELFKESVLRAVYKASPLPRAPDERVFDRELKFIFTPGM